MTSRHKSFAAAATAAASIALVVLAGGAQPAGAATAPDAAFFSGANETGTRTAVDLSKAGACLTLPQPAQSYKNWSDRTIEIYFNPDCRVGSPGETNDIHYVAGSLNSGNVPWPAVSYRVR